MAKLRKRTPNGKWTGRLTMADGTRKTVTLTTNRKASERILATRQEEQHQRRHGHVTGPENVLLAPLIEAYGQHCESRTGAAYARRAPGILRQWTTGLMMVHDVTAETIDRRVSEMLSDDGAAPSTVRTRLRVLRTFFRWAARTRRIGAIPVDVWPKVAIREDSRPHVHRVYQPDELERLQEAADAHGEVGNLVAVIRHTGLRRGEAEGLRWRDWTAAGLWVAKTKTGRDRTVPVVPELSERLRALRQRRGVAGGRADDRILVNDHGRPWNSTTAGIHLRRVLEAAGIPKRTERGVADYHGLRATLATRFGDLGFSIPMLMKWFGWRSASMAQVYVREEGIDLGRMAQALSAPQDREEGTA